MLYLDSSALVKLVVSEPETPALLEYLASQPERISSALAVVEVHRAIRRAGLAARIEARCDQVLARIGLVKVDTGVLREAAKLGPRALRSLDAVHLATALSLGDQLRAFVAYDRRLLDAAAAAGLEVQVPA